MPSAQERKRTGGLRKHYENPSGRTSANSGGKADEAARIISEASPPVLISSVEKVLPTVPPRPAARQTRQQAVALPSPPLSPQDSIVDSKAHESRVIRPPTPEDSNLSSHDTSIFDLQSQLDDVKIEIRDLYKKLDERDDEISSLRAQLNDAVTKYHDAIADAKRTQDEKNILEDQVKRLRSEVEVGTRTFRDLEEDVARRRRKERELNERIDGLSEEVRMARRVEPKADETDRKLDEILQRMEKGEVRRGSEGRERRRSRSKLTVINIEGKPSSNAMWLPFSSPPSSSKKKR